jgi:tetratricopeptide (TPR) repeat protein
LALVPIHAAEQSGAPSSAPLSRDWKRVTLGDLTAVGNAGENELRQALAALHDFRFALRHFFTRLQLDSDVPTQLVVFRDNQSFHRFKTRDERGRIREFVAGYFGGHPDVNQMVMYWSTPKEQALNVLFHEYTHYVVNRNLPSIPAWLNEGLAEFYGTFRDDYRDGRGLIGSPPEARLRTLRSGDPLIPLREMLTAEGAARIFRNPRRTSMFYAQAWALVHYLHMQRWAAGGVDLRAYLTAFSGGATEDAVRRAFGLSIEELERELFGYVQRFQFTAALLPPRPQTESETAATARLTEVEARFVQGDLLVRVGATREAEAELARVREAEPSHVGARIAIGRVRLQQDRREEAIEILDAAVRADPRSFAASYYLASAFAEDDRHVDALLTYDAALALQPRSSAALYGRSASSLALNRVVESDATFDRLLAIDSDPQWRRSRAYDAFGIGVYETAIREAARYVDAQGPGDSSAPYMAMLSSVSASRLGRMADAEATLTAAAAALIADSWPDRLVRFLRGQLDAASLIARADNDDERTEAHTYVGIMAAIEGRLDEARKHLGWVRDRGTRHFVEYEMALAELKRLDSGKQHRDHRAANHVPNRQSHVQ